MQTEAQKLAQDLSSTGAPERFAWRQFDLQVTDLKASTHFWTVSLGFRVRARTQTTVTLGTNARDLIVLHSGAERTAQQGYSGLYHLAIGVPDQAELARLFARFAAFGLPVTSVDHLTSKSLYLADPDGLGIAFTLETPERLLTYHPFKESCGMTDVTGAFRSGREPLNVKKELTPDETADIEAHVSEDTFLSHLHLSVPDLHAAVRWYEALGFVTNLVLPKIGMVDMGAGGPYGRRIALNSWSGPDIERPKQDMAKLIGYELDVQDESVFDRAKRIAAMGAGKGGTDVVGLAAQLWPCF